MLLSRNKSVYANYKILFWGEKDNKNTTFFLVLFFFLQPVLLRAMQYFIQNTWYLAYLPLKAKDSKNPQ